MYSTSPITEEQSPALLPGHYRRQAAATPYDGVWGTSAGRCGSMTLVTQHGPTFAMNPVLCDRWSCPLCGVRRAAWLKRNIQAVRVLFGTDCQFWTLTIRTTRPALGPVDPTSGLAPLHELTTLESHVLLKSAWNIYRTGINSERRARGLAPLSYCWTAESTKRGMGHLHLLTNAAVPHNEVSQRWQQATGGSWIVKVEPVTSRKAADYLAKYCSSEATKRSEQQELGGKRVFSKSRDIHFEPFRPPVEDCNDTRVWNRPYWEARRLVAASTTVLRETRTGVPALTAVGVLSDCLPDVALDMLRQALPRAADDSDRDD